VDRSNGVRCTPRQGQAQLSISGVASSAILENAPKVAINANSSNGKSRLKSKNARGRAQLSPKPAGTKKFKARPKAISRMVNASRRIHHSASRSL